MASGEFDPAHLKAGTGRSGNDPEQAIARLENLTSDDDRRHAIYNLVSRWGSKDLDAAGEWLGAQGDGPETWPARRCFARHAASVDLTSALAWVDSIGDQSIRRAAFVDVVDTWVRRNPADTPDTTGWFEERRRFWTELSAVAPRK